MSDEPYVIPDNIKNIVDLYWTATAELAKARMAQYGQVAVEKVGSAFESVAAKISLITNYAENRAKFPDKPIEFVVGRSVNQTLFGLLFGTAAEPVVGPYGAIGAQNAGEAVGGLFWDGMTDLTEQALSKAVNAIRMVPYEGGFDASSAFAPIVVVTPPSANACPGELLSGPIDIAFDLSSSSSTPASNVDGVQTVKLDTAAIAGAWLSGSDGNKYWLGRDGSSAALYGRDGDWVLTTTKGGHIGANYALDGELGSPSFAEGGEITILTGGIILSADPKAGTATIISGGTTILTEAGEPVTITGTNSGYPEVKVGDSTLSLGRGTDTILTMGDYVGTIPSGSQVVQLAGGGFTVTPPEGQSAAISGPDGSVVILGEGAKGTFWTDGMVTAEKGGADGYQSTIVNGNELRCYDDGTMQLVTPGGESPRFDPSKDAFPAEFGESPFAVGPDGTFVAGEGQFRTEVNFGDDFLDLRVEREDLGGSEFIRYPYGGYDGTGQIFDGEGNYIGEATVVGSIRTLDYTDKAPVVQRNGDPEEETPSTPGVLDRAWAGFASGLPGALGGELGGILAGLIKTKDPLMATVVHSLGSTIFREIGNAMFDAPSGDSPGLVGAVGGYFGSLVGRNLFASLGLDEKVGSFGGSVLGTAGAMYAARSVIAAVTNTAAPSFGAILETSAFSAVGSYLGGMIGDALFGPGDPMVTSIGSTVATLALAATFEAMKVFAAFGSFAGPVGMLVGAVVGSILGHALGSLFGGGKHEPPPPYAAARIQFIDGKFAVAGVSTANGGSAKAARNMATAAINKLQAIIGATGGQVANIYDKIDTIVGYNGASYFGSGHFNSSAKAIDSAVFKIARALEIDGGAPLVKRALYRSDAKTLTALVEDVQAARTYSTYLDNPGLFLNTIEGSGATQADRDKWEKVLARVAALHLDEADPADDREIITREIYLREFYGKNPPIGVDPLVLDLNGNGKIDLVQMADSSASFDSALSGFSRRVGWVTGGDGFLVYDKNGDGVVNDPTEMFSEFFGGGATTGFAALAALDSNGDSIFDYRDAEWDNVRVWIDEDQDGQTDLGEFKRLDDASLDIAAISLTGIAENGVPGGDTHVVRSGTFTHGDGSTDLVADVFFESGSSGMRMSKTSEGWSLMEFEGQSSTISSIGTGARSMTFDSSKNQYVSGSEDADVLTAQGATGVMIVGHGGDDTIQGAAGDDWLVGGLGSDTLRGGDGDDLLVIDAMDNMANIDGGAGRDAVVVDDSFGVTIDLGVIHAEAIQGGSGNDTLTASQGFAEGASGVVMDGDAGNDRLTGSMGNDGLAGGEGDDTVDGGAGSDTLDGGAGKDKLQGGAGDDVLYFDADDVMYVDDKGVAHYDSADFTVDGGAGRDIGYFEGIKALNMTLSDHGLESLVASIGSDTLVAGTSQDVWIRAMRGNDTVIGGSGRDTLDGGEGNDTLDGGAGADTLEGGRGDDVYVVDSADDVVIEKAGEGVDTVQTSLGAFVLGGSLENLRHLGGGDFIGTGNSGDNQITGGAGADTLTGFGGNDTLDGGAGADTLLGGLGDDRFVVDDEGDVVIENAGEGNDTIVTSLTTVTLGANLENLTYTGSQAFVGVGTAADNVMKGGSGADTLTGGDGNDVLDGGAGADTLDGGAGNDTYRIDSALDVIVEDGGVDTVEVSGLASFSLADLGAIENMIFTGTGKFAGTGNAAANRLEGGDGNDTLDGGGGADTLVGGSGDDVYVVDDVGDTVIDSAGKDTVRTTFNSYGTGGGIEGIEFIGTGVFVGTGGDGADEILGGAEGDTLIGGAGNDTLDGRGGADTMNGGTGDDVYYVDAGDVIVDEGGTDTVKTAVSAYVAEEAIEKVVYTGAGSAVFRASADREKEIAFVGGANADSLFGSLGNDTLDGGAGADVLQGGHGDDLYCVDNVGDAVSDDDGHDTVVVTGLQGWQLQSGIEVLRYAGTADFTATGNSGANTITTGDGNDVLNGDGGDDTLDGGAGGDFMRGGAGNDLYKVDSYDDEVVEAQGAGVDTVTIIGRPQPASAATSSQSNGTDSAPATRQYVTAYLAPTNVEKVVYVGTDDVVITGNGLRNTIITDSGDDTIDGGIGGDIMEGNAGNDVYIVDSVDDVVVETAQETELPSALDGDGLGERALPYDTVMTSLASYSLTDYIERLYYTGTGAFAGAGNGLDNLIAGGSGADTLDGGSGRDTLLGGAGNDSYWVDDEGDQVVEAASAGTDTVYVTRGRYALAYDSPEHNRNYAKYTLADNVENLVRVGDDSFFGLGNTLANVMTGGGGADTFDGGAGNDTLDGGAGDDMLIGGGDNDKLIGGEGNDLLDGGNGNDAMLGGAGDDRYIVNSSTDTVTENAGGGYDTVVTSLTTYTLGANVEELIYIGPAKMYGLGNVLNNKMTGDDGDDTLYARDGDDSLLGGYGDDSLYGEGGNDWIDGGDGADSMSGGAGDDVYIVDSVGDVVVEAASAGIDTVWTKLSQYTLAANVEDLEYQGDGDFLGIGNALANSLSVANSAGHVTLDGGAGDDWLYNAEVMIGGDGNDTFFGDAGSTMIGGTGDDLYVLYDVASVISEAAGEGVDTVQFGWSLKPVDYTLGCGLENLVFASAGVGRGNEGANVMTAAGDSVTLDGAGGDDTLILSFEGASLIGGIGNDTVVLSEIAANYSFTRRSTGEIDVWNSAWGLHNRAATISSVENVQFADQTMTVSAALAGTGVITGSVADETLTGTAGNDLIDGNGGNDRAEGGAGNDVYVFDRAEYPGSLTISDSDGTADVLRLYNSRRSFFGSDVGIQAKKSGNNLIIGIGVGAWDELQKVTILNWSVSANRIETIQWQGTYWDEIRSVDYAHFGDLLGSSDADTISWTTSSLTIDGKDGNDVITSGSYNDTLTGGGGDDTLIAGAGNDYLDGGWGDDTLTGGTGADVFACYSGNDVITSVDSGDEIYTNAWSSGYYTRAGTDLKCVYDGGSLTVRGWFTSIGVSIDGVSDPATLSLTQFGTGANETIVAGDGADTIFGGGGTDTLQGGLGDDTYSFARLDGKDLISEAGGADTLQFGGDILRSDLSAKISGTNLVIGVANGGTTFASLSDVVTISGWTAAATRVETIKVSDGNQVLTLDVEGIAGLLGTNEADTITWTETRLVNDGKAGNDVITAGAFNDTISGGDGNDTLTGAAGVDLLSGGNGDDTLVGGIGNDTLTGGAGNDVFKVAHGFGYDVITDFDPDADKIMFDTTSAWGYGINRVGDDLVLQPFGYDETITLTNYYRTHSALPTVVLNNGTAAAIANVINGTTITLSGTAAVDFIYADGLANRISAAAGDDQIYAGAGNDSVDGGLGNDLLDGGDGDDTLTGNDGDDVLDEGAGDGTLSGNAGNDILYGGAGKDKLDGGADDDTLDGGAGDDTLTGGTGSDTYVFGRGSGKDTVITADGADTLMFGAGIAASDITFTKSGNNLLVTLKDRPDDLLTLQNWFSVPTNRIRTVKLASGEDVPVMVAAMGTASAQTISGHEERDLIDGGAGNDSLVGGAGDDVYVFNRGGGNDTIVDDYWITEAVGDSYVSVQYDAGQDVLQFGADVKPEDVSAVLSGANLVLKLAATAETVTLRDWTKAMNRIETVRFADGTSLDVQGILGLLGTAAADTVKWTETSLAMDGKDGDDVITAGAYANSIVGGAGNDTISTGAGANIIDGGDGNDTVTTSSGADTIRGGAGNDIINAGNGANTVGGGDGDDTITAGTGADTIDGAQGKDTIIAGSGDDLIDGGLGDDTITTGTGVDTVYFEIGSGNDTLITGDGAVDVIQLTGPVGATNLAFSREGDNLRIQLTSSTIADSSLTVQGWFLSDNNRVAKLLLPDGTEVPIRVEQSSSTAVTLAGHTGGDVMVATADVTTTLAGNTGNDLYHYDRGASPLTIYDAAIIWQNTIDAGNDTLEFGKGIDVSDLKVALGSKDLTVTVAGGLSSDVITIKDWRTATTRVENFCFSGSGDMLDLAGILALLRSDTADTFTWTESALSLDSGDGADVITAGNFNDSLLGGAGNDTLSGAGGNDLLDGGAGDDTLLGGTGKNVYRFGLGGGHDVIDAGNGGSDDTLVFGAGIAATDITFTKSGSNLLASLAGHPDDQLTLLNWFSVTKNRIRTVELSSGENVAVMVATTGTAIGETISGHEERDVIDGGAGNDSLVGGNGDDVYLFNRGGGNDTIYDDYRVVVGESVVQYDAGKDVLQFGADVALRDVSAVLSGTNLVLKLAATDTQPAETVTLRDWTKSMNRIETIRFADGTSLDVQGILGLLGTAAADTITWTGTSLAMDGKQGDDVLTGGNFNDTLSGGDGNDKLTGGAGNDTLSGGSGNDTLTGGTGTDVALYADVDRLQATVVRGAAGVATVTTATGTDVLSGIEVIRFRDGEVSLTGNNAPILPGITVINRPDAATKLTANQLLAGSRDVDGDVLRIVNAGSAIGGKVALDAQGSVTFTPTAGYAGVAGFAIEVSDGKSVATRQVRFDANPLNSLSMTAEMGRSLSGTVAPGTVQGLTYAIEGSQPAHGTLALNGDGTFTYRPVDGFTGTDTFIVRGSDAFGHYDLETITVAVTPNKDVVVGTGTTVWTGGSANDDVVSFDMDRSEADIQVNSGTVTVVSAHGRDILTSVEKVRFADGDITTTANNAPIVASKALLAPLIGTLTIQASDLLAGARDVEGDALTLTSVGNAVGGEVGLDASGNVVFTPTAGYTGQARFEFTVSDGHGTTTQSVRIDPDAVKDVTITAEMGVETSGTVKPTGIEGLTYALVTGPLHGQATLAADGTYVYTSRDSFTGTDSFVVEGVGLQGKDRATITVTVAPKFVAGTEGKLDRWVGGTQGEVFQGGAGQSIAGGGGVDIVTYLAQSRRDTQIVRGLIGCATVTTSVGTDIVSGVEILRFADGDVSLTANNAPIVPEHSFIAFGSDPVTFTQADLLEGAQDVEGHEMMVVGFADVHGGKVENNKTTTDLVFTPSAGEASGDFTIEVTDGRISSKQVVRIGNMSTQIGAAVTARVIGASSPVVSVPAENGALDVGDGFIVYRPNDGFTGIDQFTVTSGGQTRVVTVTVGTGHLFGADGVSTWAGGTGDDTIDGSSGADVLRGASGKDVYISGRSEGFDVIDNRDQGGDGDVIQFGSDVLVSQLLFKQVDLDMEVSIQGTRSGVLIKGWFESEANQISEICVGGQKLTPAEITGKATQASISMAEMTLRAGVKELTFTGKGPFRGTGNELANTISGGSGADTLDGGAGADTLVGGAGNDVFLVDNVGDVVRESADGGIDEVRTTLTSLTLGANVEKATYQGSGDFTAIGNAGANILVGASGNDTLDGSTGVDTLLGGDGDDAYVVDSLLDIVSEVAGGGIDSIRASSNYVLGAEVENLTYTGTGSFIGTGNALDNTIIGASGDDTLTGGAGGDRLEAGSDGVDSLDYSASTAGVRIDLATNTAAGGDAAGDVLVGVFENVTGTAYDDVLTGNDQANSLVGGSGNDTLDGGAGNDTMSGGLGNDVYVVGETGDVVSDTGGTDTIVTTLSAYTLDNSLENLTYTGGGNFVGVGNSSANTLIGGSGADTLSGGSGDDTIDGGTGADTLNGGAGNDVFLVDDIGDVVGESSGAGTDEVRTTLTSFTLGANLERLTYQGSGNFTGIGNGFSNVIVGGIGSDTLDGGAGTDILIGGAGDDVYVIDNYLDIVSEIAGGGSDTIRTLCSSYALDAEFENLTYTGTGLFTGTGNASDNTMIGGQGGNSLFGGAGCDTLIGGFGNDTLTGGTGGDRLDAGSGGIDALNYSGSAGAVTVDLAANVASGGDAAGDMLVGVFENVTGSAYDDVLTGNGQANSLVGGSGNDTLDGGAGNDTMSGGMGNDVYVVGEVGDVVSDTGGTDTVVTTLSAYTLGSSIENLTYTGSGTFVGTGNSSANTLIGGAGDDTLWGGQGADRLDGGSGGNDWASYTGSIVGVTVSLATGTGTGWSYSSDAYGDVLVGIENLLGSSYADALTGDGTANTLDGGAGDDTLTGGAGDDVYVVDNLSDVTSEVAGGGVDTVRTTLVSYTLQAEVENLTYSGGGFFSGTGNGGDNAIIGGQAGNSLSGGVGSDTLTGGSGNDTLAGGAGGDTLDAGGGGVDTLNYGTSTAGVTIDLSVNGASGGDAAGDVLVGIFENLTGSAYDDVLTGNDLANSLVGGSGNDILDGGDGNDTLTDSAGTNMLLGGSGNDTVFGGTGNDTLDGGDGNDYLSDSAGTNILLGGAGDDTLHGGSGADTLDGGTGNDTMSGGLGNDVYVVTEAGDVVFDSGGTDLVLTTLSGYTLGSSVENLSYTGAGTFWGIGNSLANILTAESGDDTLDGGSGADTLVGGAGNDVYVVDNSSDVVSEMAGGGIDIVRTTSNYALGAEVENLTFVGTGTFFGTGNALDNTITGGLGTNVLSGAAGNDTLIGGSGNDTLTGGAGGDRLDAGGGGIDDTLNYAASTAGVTIDLAANMAAGGEAEGDVLVGVFEDITGSDYDDVLTGNSQANSLIGGLGNDTLDGGDGNDTLSDSAGTNLLLGGAGADTLYGGSGADTLDGGTGNDTMSGGLGNDVYVVTEAGDVVSDSGGTDLVLTTLSAYTLGSSIENLTYTGTGTFVGTGNSLANTLIGGAGDDTLWGGYGADRLDGGTGGNDWASYTGSGLGVAVNLATGLGTGASSFYDSVLDVYYYNYGAGDVLVGIENLLGSSKADLLTGDGNANTLDGGAGADTLVGGAGNDTYVVDSLSDVVSEVAGGGIDMVRTALSSYALGAEVENLTYTGTGSFTGTGNALDNTLIGGSGNDTLAGGAGCDTLDAGSGGVDTLNYSTSAAGVTIDLSINTASGGDAAGDVLVGAFENVTGSSYNDVLTGNGQANSLVGGSGNDTLDGGDGNDYLSDNAGTNTLYGGSGNDTLYGGSGADTLDGGTGNDTMSGGLGNDVYVVTEAGDVVSDSGGTDLVLTTLSAYTLGSSIENLTYTGTGTFVGTGNSLANTLIGGAGDDTLWGGYGADRLDGGTGGNDWASYTGSGLGVAVNLATGLGTGASSFYDSVLDVYYYNYGAGDVLVGIENLLGSSKTDLLTGDGNANTLDGGAGADTLVGGAGNDTYVVDSLSDVVSEVAGGGIDMVRTALSSYALGAEVENLTYTGTGSFTGTGNALDNTLIGGSGNDTLAGGAGCDTYLFGVGAGSDLIDNRGHGTEGDIASLGVNHDQLWFVRANQDLKVSVVGTSDSILVKSWYDSAANQLSFRASDGQALLAGDVEALVTAMAGLVPPPMGQTWLTPDQHVQLDPVIASNWRIN